MIRQDEQAGAERTLHLIQVIGRALKEIGVTRAGTESDPYRWSASDLATDLAAKLPNCRGPERPAEESGRNQVIECLHYLIRTAQKTAGAEVWRALFAGLMAGYERK